MSSFRVYVLRCDQCGAEIRSPSPYVPMAQARREGWLVARRGLDKVNRDVCAACVKAQVA